MVASSSERSTRGKISIGCNVLSDRSVSASPADADIGSRSTGASRTSRSQRLSLKVDAHGQIVRFPELPVMGQAILDRYGSEMDAKPTTEKRGF